MVPVAGVTLTQVPPPGVPVSAVVSPTHEFPVPEIEGSALIVTIAEVAEIVGQPVVLADNV